MQRPSVEFTLLNSGIVFLLQNLNSHDPSWKQKSVKLTYVLHFSSFSAWNWKYGSVWSWSFWLYFLRHSKCMFECVLLAFLPLMLKKRTLFWSNKAPLFLPETVLPLPRGPCPTPFIASYSELHPDALSSQRTLQKKPVLIEAPAQYLRVLLPYFIFLVTALDTVWNSPVCSFACWLPLAH